MPGVIRSLILEFSGNPDRHPRLRHKSIIINPAVIHDTDTVKRIDDIRLQDQRSASGTVFCSHSKVIACSCIDLIPGIILQSADHHIHGVISRLCGKVSIATDDRKQIFPESIIINIRQLLFSEIYISIAKHCRLSVRIKSYGLRTQPQQRGIHGQGLGISLKPIATGKCQHCAARGCCNHLESVTSQ